MNKTISTLRISCLFIIALFLALGVGAKITRAGTYQYTIETGSYEIVDAGDGYQEIKMENFGQLLDPGKPKLPSKIFTIAIPPGTDVVSVQVEGENPTKLEGSYTILPTPSPMPGNNDESLIQKANEIYERNYQATYSSDAPYPENRGKFITQGGYRKYNIVDVRFTPFEYRPQSKKLYFYPRATVTITYAPGILSKVSEGLLSENIQEVEEKAQELILNYEEALDWYQPLVAPGAPGYEFVIVTTEDLQDSVWPIKNWEMCKGQGVYVATTSWINTNFSGSDLAAKIRTFLRTYLSTWNILKVLLVGDISDVPMRYCYTPDPWGVWTSYPTDYYYAELTNTDYYSWDSDHDGLYGERGQDSIDFLTEVDVGRIPWSDPDTVESICLKMADYEYSTNTAFKKNVLLPEAFWDVNTDNAVLADMMWNNFYSASGYTRWRIFEYGPHYYSTYTRDETLTHSNVVNRWSGGSYGAVCWSGHGSATSVSYDADHNWYTLIHSDDSDDLNDNYPSVIYSNSCSTAYPENSNNLGRQMLENGGVAFVGSVRVMGYMPYWDELSDGWGSTLAYLFSQKSRYAGGSSIGWSHTRALRNMYTTYGWGNEWSSMFEYVLYGNPDLWIQDRPSALPNLDYLYRTGWDYPIVPRSAAGATSTWCPVTSTLPGNTADTYYNWTWENNGSVTSPSARTRIFVDEDWMGYSSLSLGAGGSTSHMNWNYGPTLTGGRHTIYYYIDEDEEVWETSESDNCWGHQFVWSPYSLADDTPVTRSAGPYADAGGCGFLYYNNDGFSFNVQAAYPNKYWSAVGVLPYSSDADYDLRLYDIGNYTGSEAGFGGGYLEYSYGGGATSDFVIVNDNMATAGIYTVGAINKNNATGNYHIEEATSTKIYNGTNGAYSMSSAAVLDIYEYYISTAGDYGFKLDQTAGTCDLGMSLYDDETVHCSKSEYMTGGYANSTGDGGDEYMRVTIPDTGFHGLAVWKADSSDYAKTTTYNIKVGRCATPGALSGPSPADGATNVSVDTDLDWADCADTEYYEVWLNDGSGWIKLGETETSAWALPTLNDGTHYDWFIAANNICGSRIYVYWDFTTESTAPPCEGNFDGDHDVDGSDLAVFAADFGRTDCGTGAPCEGNFDGDNDVDGSDLAVFAADFGRTDCP